MGLLDRLRGGRKGNAGIPPAQEEMIEIAFCEGGFDKVAGLARAAGTPGAAELMSGRARESEALAVAASRESPESPWPLLVLGGAQAMAERDAEACATLRRALALGGLEARTELLVWNGIKRLGGAPDPQDRGKVLGLFFEFAMEGGIDRLAVYADGRARYFNFSGAMIIWEAQAPFEPPVKELVRAAGKVPLPRATEVPPVMNGPIRIHFLTSSGRFIHEDMGEKKGEPCDTLIDGALSLIGKMIEFSMKSKG